MMSSTTGEPKFDNSYMGMITFYMSENFMFTIFFKIFFRFDNIRKRYSMITEQTSENCLTIEFKTNSICNCKYNLTVPLEELFLPRLQAVPISFLETNSTYSFDLNNFACMLRYSNKMEGSTFSEDYLFQRIHFSCLEILNPD